MNQTDRIKAALERGELCAMSPLDWQPRITRVAARICDLRDRGTYIESRPCYLHGRGHVSYRLADEQPTLFGE